MFSGRLKVETLASMFGLAREAVVEDYTVGYLMPRLQFLARYRCPLRDY